MSSIDKNAMNSKGYSILDYLKPKYESSSSSLEKNIGHERPTPSYPSAQARYPVKKVETKESELDFFASLERQEQNRNLHEQERQQWSFLSKRKQEENTSFHRQDSGQEGYYNDKRSRYTDSYKWDRQLEQLQLEKDIARVSSSKYTIPEKEDVNNYRVSDHNLQRNNLDSAYCKSGVTDLYSVGRAHASFLDDGYDQTSSSSSSKARVRPEEDIATHAVIVDIHKYVQQSSSKTEKFNSNKESSSDLNNTANSFLQNFNINYQNQLLTTDLSNGKDLDILINSSIDSICVEILKLNLKSVLDAEEAAMQNSHGSCTITNPPLSFIDVNKYISTYQPLLIEEFKAALISYILDLNSDEKIEHSIIQTSANSHSSSTNREFQAIEVRPEVISQRSNEVKLQEAHLRVLRNEDHGIDFIRDELVLVVNKRLTDDVKTRRQLVKEKHFLGIVLSSTSRRSQTSKTFTVLLNQSHQHDRDKDQKNTWTCVPMFNLSSFLREWHALLSMKHMQSMPLAGYLLNGSPVVSASQLSAMSDGLITKLRALESACKYKATVERIGTLEQAVENDLQIILETKVNIALLKFTSIGKDIKHITKNKEGFFSQKIVSLAEKIMTTWTALVKAEEKTSTIRTKKGGKILKIPDGADLTESKSIPNDLWLYLRAEYNNSQLFAIEHTMQQFQSLKESGIVLVQGPPGTGKTSTIIGMLSALLHSSAGQSNTTNNNVVIQSTPRRILICAPSNTAIDEVISRLSTQGIISADIIAEPGIKPRKSINIVRLGDPQQFNPTVQATVLEEQVEKRLKADALYVQHVNLISALAEQEKRLYEMGGQFRSTNHNKNSLMTAANANKDNDKKRKTEYEKCKDAVEELYVRKTQCERAMDKLRAEFRYDILFTADVICTTLSSSNKQHFLDYILKEQIFFNTVIIDEAAQTTEISTLIPLRLGCRHLVLIGDPRQLPATVLSRTAQAGGLGRSLFERLESLEHEVVMLTTQYRMHPEIRQFPSDYFYQGLLRDAPIVQAEVEDNRDFTFNGRVTSSTLQRLQLKPVMFISMSGNESKAGTSYVNDNEAINVLDILRAMVRKNVHKEESIAVISPYKAQVRKIKNKIKQDHTLQSLSDMEVNSIDGFQGRERDIIILSTVRSNSMANSKASIGFVADERRLNVAITRARKALIILGNQHTLAADQVWQAMIRSLRQRDLMFQDMTALQVLLR